MIQLEIFQAERAGSTAGGPRRDELRPPSLGVISVGYRAVVLAGSQFAPDELCRGMSYCTSTTTRATWDRGLFTFAVYALASELLD